MTAIDLARTLNAAQKQLDAMRVDAEELDRLHLEKLAELKTLQDGGTRDFRAMATVEGERAALEAMRGRQWTAVADAEQHLQTLDAQRARETHVQAVADHAAQIMATRDELHTGLLALVEALTPELARLIGLRTRWAELRAVAIDHATEAGGTKRSDYRAYLTDAFMEELTARGTDPAALLLTLGFLPELGPVRTDELPTPPGHVNGYSLDAWPEQVKALVGAMFWDATNLYHRVNSPKAIEHRAQREGTSA